MNVKQAIIGGLLALTAASPALGQDFFNGMRGPRSTQLDMYATHKDGETNHTVIPKLFAGNLLVAAPFSVSEEGLENKGINTGYIADDLGAIGALGLFKNSDGKYKVLNPQIYATQTKGPWSFDVEGNIPINLETGETGANASATIGRGLSDRLRIGGSVITSEGKEPIYRANARVELTKDHQFWTQLYVDKDSIGARLATNF